MNTSSVEGETVIGEECHIVAREINGPRGNAPLPIEARDDVDNLILLCRNHHKLIDDQPNTFTEKILKVIRSEHENWVRESLSPKPEINDRKYKMHVPIIQGVIDRRILVNYRINPKILFKILPSPFEPKLINGYGIAGICLIRLKEIRPRYLPRFVGLSSENAAHRIAVQWKANGEQYEGVYIPRRDTSSLLNTLVGGRLFPGVHHHAHFEAKENDKHYRIDLKSDDNNLSVVVEAEVGQDLPKTSVFKSINEASDFFESGSLGYSPTHSNEFDGLELRTFNWKVDPLTVSKVHSSFFEDKSVFPEVSTEFDCALLMTGIKHEWHAREPICT